MISSGPAIVMSENNIENISNTPVVFVNPQSEVSNTNTQKCSQISSAENHIDHTHDANHVLQPAKTENINLALNKKSLQMQGKTALMNNCVVEKKVLMTTVGASGDGLQQNEKIVLLKNQANMTSSSIEDDKSGINNTMPGIKTKLTSKIDGQTYALAARNLFSRCEQKEDQTTTETVSSESIHNQPLSNDSTVATAVEMNGISQESLDTADSITAEKNSTADKNLKTKALKETIGHISSRLPDDSSNNRTNDGIQLSNDQEIQILSNPERTNEAGIQDVVKENSISNMEQDILTAKLSNNSLRREAEKPPRMQKQRSQDRLLSKQQKPGFDSENKREMLSRESSVECVDSTGVAVHEFLITTLRNSTRDRAILLKIEHDMIDFVNDKTIDFMKFPPMTSYHRMLVHRVAAYFGMDHNVDETGKSVIINKTSSTRLPDVRFADQFDPRQPDPHSGRQDGDMRRRSILKRTNQSRSFDRDDMKGMGLWKDNRQRSIEEREEQYKKVRSRIFNNQEVANMQSPMYNRRGISSVAAARMASWTDRPWNSTDLEPMSSSMRMPLSRPLTTRASSYSSISVLPRHNSATSVKTGSSSSVSSMNGINNGIQNFSQNRQPINMGNPRPPTPNRRGGGSNSAMGDNNNGTFYYMQQQGQGMPYLSPEGYQLVYQSGPGSAGMTSPQFAQYYQMPPQPSPQHPGMTYGAVQGYNPYQDSPQKGTSNMSQAASSTDYTMMTSMPNYQQQNLSSTTTVYSGTQGNQNIAYPYHPPTSSIGGGYSKSYDQSIPPAPSSQAGIPMNQMITNNHPQPPATPSGYPQQYILTQHPPNSTPVPGQPSSGKDGTPVQNSAGGTPTPRAMMAQPMPVMQPAMYQQPGMQVIYSPPTQTNVAAVTASNVESYSQHVHTNEATKSSNQQQQSEPKKLAEDELNEKMQAIVLKNLQQQQTQVQDVTGSNSSSNTVTTSISPSNNQIQSTKPPQQQQQITVVQDQTGQNRIMTHPPPSSHHRHVSGNSQPQIAQGYQYHQYATNSNGMQQPQMQVYLMPTNAQNSGPASYRTYSQFMTPPQTPHVMGTGMHLVYLSPPPMMGIDSSGNSVPIPPNVQTMMHNPTHQHQLRNQSQQSVEPATQVYTSNTNNNNVQSIAAEVSHQNPQKSIEKPDVPETTQRIASDDIVENDKQNNSVDSPVDNNIPVNTSTNPVGEITADNDDLQPTNNTEVTHENGASASSAPTSEHVSQSDNPVAASTSSTIVESNQRQQTIMTTAHTSSNHSHNHHVHPHQHHHHHHPAIQYSNSPMMIHPDYRMTGIPVNAASYPAGVIPQYSMYPTPYVYLPTATSNRNPKLPEVKMFPTQATSHSPGLIAVHVPNQNHIQLVPAASLQQQNQIYYTQQPQSYIPTDYTNQPVAQTTQHTAPPYAKQEEEEAVVIVEQSSVGNINQNHVHKVPEEPESSEDITEESRSVENKD